MSYYTELKIKGMGVDVTFTTGTRQLGLNMHLSLPTDDTERHTVSATGERAVKLMEKVKTLIVKDKGHFGNHTPFIEELLFCVTVDFYTFCASPTHNDHDATETEINPIAAEGFECSVTIRG